MVWLLCSMCQLVTAVRLILKFLSINSHRFPIKFPWENSKQLVKPFCECALSLFVLQHWRLCGCFVLGCWNYAVPFFLCPTQCRQKRAEAIGKLKGTVCLRCLKTVLVVSLWRLVWLVIGSGAHLVYELWSSLSLRIWISISAFYKIIWKSSFFSVFFCFEPQERQDGTV